MSTLGYKLIPIEDDYFDYKVEVWDKRTNVTTKVISSSGETIYTMNGINNFRETMLIKSDWFNNCITHSSAITNHVKVYGRDPYQTQNYDTEVIDINPCSYRTVNGQQVPGQDISSLNVPEDEIEFPSEDPNGILFYFFNRYTCFLYGYYVCDPRFNKETLLDKTGDMFNHKDDSIWYYYSKLVNKTYNNQTTTTDYWDYRTIHIIDDSAWIRPADGQGTGTEADPIQIYTVKDLVLVRKLGTEPGTYFTLMNDLDLSECWKWDFSGYNGDDALIRNFKGVFDGNGHKLYNFVSVSSEYASFIMHLVGGTVRNLGIENCTLLCQNKCGALVGYADTEALIENCYATGTIMVGGQSSGNNGGLVRSLDEGSTVKNCYFVGEVILKTNSLAVTYTQNSDGSVKTASVTAFENFSGVVGTKSSNSVVSNCYAVPSYIVLSSGFSDADWQFDVVSFPKSEVVKYPELLKKSNIQFQNWCVGGSGTKYLYAVCKSLVSSTDNYYDYDSILQQENCIVYKLSLKIPSELSNTYWTRNSNINYGYPFLFIFKGVPSWETTVFTELKASAITDLKAYIINNWRYLELFDNNGNALFRVDTKTDTRASWVITDEGIHLQVIITGNDGEMNNLPVTLRKIALYKLFSGGNKMTEELFLPTTVTRHQDQVMINYNIKFL